MKSIRQHTPHENLIYVADQQFAPYGEKPLKEIINRALKIVDWLITQNVKMIVVACNTATLAAIKAIRAHTKIPIIGVEPAIKPAVQRSKNKKIGFLVTQATAQSLSFKNLISNHKKTSEIFIQPCPGLVELIEMDKHNSDEGKRLVKQFLKPLEANNVDTIVLGCTHYPFIDTLIQEQLGKYIKLMETALPVTEQLNRQLDAHCLANNKNAKGSLNIYSTQKISNQQAIFTHLLEIPVTVQHLTI